MTERLHFHFWLWCVGEGNSNPLQCLPGESQGRGSLVGSVSRVAQSRTQLKWLSSSSSNSNAYIPNLEKWYWRIYLQGRNGETDIENRHVHEERGGEGEMYAKSNMETYITICKLHSQWEFAVWLRKLEQGLCITLDGWDVEGDGRRFKREGYMYIYGWFMLRFDRKHQIM